jgi:hypothetical protein
MARLTKEQIAVFALATCLALPFGAADSASAAPRHAGRHYAGHRQGWHGGRAYGYRGGYRYGGDAGAAAAAGVVGGLVAGAVAAGVAAGAQPYYGGPYATPNCWIENRSAWNGYQWIVQPVQVCP